MILYHGTNLVIDQIDLSVCRPNKDFGQGFYLTTIEDQAQKMAKRVARIYGGDPTVNVYRFDEAVLETDHLSVFKFAQPSVEWALFVINNRNGVSDGDNNLDFKYDIVIGPVADDDLSMLFSLLSRKIIEAYRYFILSCSFCLCSTWLNRCLKCDTPLGTANI